MPQMSPQIQQLLSMLSPQQLQQIMGGMGMGGNGSQQRAIGNNMSRMPANNTGQRFTQPWDTPPQQQQPMAPTRPASQPQMYNPRTVSGANFSYSPNMTAQNRWSQATQERNAMMREPQRQPQRQNPGNMGSWDRGGYEDYQRRMADDGMRQMTDDMMYRQMDGGTFASLPPNMRPAGYPGSTGGAPMMGGSMRRNNAMTMPARAIGGESVWNPNTNTAAGSGGAPSQEQGDFGVNTVNTNLPTASIGSRAKRNQFADEFGIGGYYANGGMVKKMKKKC